MARQPTVHVVDDDTSVQRAVGALFDSEGVRWEGFASAAELVERLDDGCAGCLLLDVRMPGMSGLELQEELRTQGIMLPIVFMTAHADVPMTVRAMKAGAADFVEKPFNEQLLLEAVHRALETDTRQRRAATEKEDVAAFLQNMLGSLDPAVARGRDTALLERMLAEAAVRVDTELADEPAVAATLRTTIGTTYQALGRYDAAGEHLQAALETRRALYGEADPATAASLARFASVLHNQGEYALAEEGFRAALEHQRAAQGDAHDAVALTLHELATLLLDQSRLEEAEALFREALAIRRELHASESLPVARGLFGLAAVLQARGEYDAARQLYEEALAIRREALGDLHPDVVAVLNELAALDKTAGDYASAEARYREALEMQRALLDAGHPDLGVGAEQSGGGVAVAGGRRRGRSAVSSGAGDVSRAAAGGASADQHGSGKPGRGAASAGPV
jgi:FixJ family two-component response regulator/Tfp pilus assembly protein PilF